MVFPGKSGGRECGGQSAESQERMKKKDGRKNAQNRAMSSGLFSNLLTFGHPRVLQALTFCFRH
jgi:hypothetical protein